MLQSWTVNQVFSKVKLTDDSKLLTTFVTPYVRRSGSRKTKQEYEERLNMVLTILEKANLTLNPDKCEFKKREVQYVGHLLTNEGIKHDQEKVRAVENMKAQTDKKELMTGFGFIQYLSNFFPLSSNSEKRRYC